jgi:hypothetical protein
VDVDKGSKDFEDLAKDVVKASGGFAPCAEGDWVETKKNHMASGSTCMEAKQRCCGCIQRELLD